MIKKIVFNLILICSFSNLIFSQTKVSGVVYDDTNQTLPFANIYFKGNKTGVESDENGKFKIESKSSSGESVICFIIGF